MRGRKYCVFSADWGPQERCLLGGDFGAQVSNMGMSLALGSPRGWDRHRAHAKRSGRI